MLESHLLCDFVGSFPVGRELTILTRLNHDLCSLKHHVTNSYWLEFKYPIAEPTDMELVNFLSKESLASNRRE